ncbi:translation initiation factor 3 subunit eif3H [Acrasis kona]|uniref:Translation initiation factor 3 subunit eif3H n=1 Tax=Acrasis kona TaxID=1008807 RepID=A0AAW2YKE1_9EUKA
MTQAVEFDDAFVKEMEEEKKKDITNVSIDGLALLKIINHCTEKIPASVSGTLLGLNVRDKLEVSNCFPLPTRKIEEDGPVQLTEEQIKEELSRYQLSVLKNYRTVNVDNNTVGWYQSTYLESYVNAVTIDTQYSYQMQFGSRCILLIFDPLRTRRGNLHLKAVRLTKKFLNAIRTSFEDTQNLDALKKKHSAKKSSDTDALRSQYPSSIEETIITQEVLTKLNFTYEDIFEQVPLEINNSHLVQSYLSNLSTHSFHQLQSSISESSLEVNDVDALLEATEFTPLSTFDNLDLSSAPFLERAIESLIESNDYLTSEQNKYQQYQRRLQQKQFFTKKKEMTADEQDFALKSVAQPNQIDALMMSNQMNQTCDSIGLFASQSVSKLYLADALFKHD